MSAELDFAFARNSSAVQNILAASPQSFHPTGTNRMKGSPVYRSPEQLRLHRALEELGWAGVIGEFNRATRLTNASSTEPILITTSGTILAGFGRWQLAAFEGVHEIDCIEYLLSEDEALRFTLSYQQTRCGWNAFVRIRLALTLEPVLQEQALANMRLGGKYKGLAKLPEAQQIDVRKDIGHVAGVCARNVGKVKSILQTAHPRLLEALQDGTLSINQATYLCRMPKAMQLEQFMRCTSERAINGVISETISRLGKVAINLDALTVLSTLQQHEGEHPGSVTVRATQRQRTIVLIGQDLVSVTLEGTRK